MLPHNSRIPSHNPRKLIEQEGAAGLAALIEQTGYVIQAELLRDLVHALRSGLPMLLEGGRGSGKSALGLALGEACNLPMYYLQGMDGLTIDDVLYSWDRDGQTQFVKQATGSGLTLAEARSQQWSREYLVMGEALAAYEAAGASEELTPIFMLDEIDKISEQIEDMLLQLFASGYAHIPRYGEIGVRDRARWPIVMLLSNNIRHDLSPPLRSRCLYAWLDPPTPKEELKILLTRCRQAPPTLVIEMVKMINAIRGMAGIVDKPGLRESIELIQALQAQGIAALDGAIIQQHLCYLGKRHSDLQNLGKGIARLETAIKAKATEYDAWMFELQETEARGASQQA